MQQPSNPYPQFPQQQWQEQPTSWGSSPQWQQAEALPPQYPQQMPPPHWQPPPMPPQQQWNQQQPPYPQPPLQEPKRAWYRRLLAWCRRHPIVTAAIIVALLAFGALATLSNSSQPSTPTPTTQPTQARQQVQVTPTYASKPTPTQKPAPTQQPTPRQSTVQTEHTYKSTTMNTTVDDLDKQGNNYRYEQVHFTAHILNFVKDASGNTAGANVDTPNSSSSSVVQVAFPAGTDLSRLNQGDTIEVWGMDNGTSSGQNAFGGTVQEVGIAALYLTDLTTNYSTS